MHGNSHQVITETNGHLQSIIDLKTERFSPEHRALTGYIAGAMMAELIWESDNDPKAEKKWEIPKVAVEVANTIVDRAARVVSTREYTESDVREFCASPELRQIAAEMKAEILALLDRRARGR